MANRRSLIGEVSLPKISEKMWNRINVELFDDTMGKSYSAIVNLDYAVSNDTDLIVCLSDSFGSSFRIEDSFGTYHTFLGHFLGSSQGVTVNSWTPLEDDNYKYIVFPMHLEVGDNGDKGKVLFEYLLDGKFDNDTIYIIDANNNCKEVTDYVFINNDKVRFYQASGKSFIFDYSSSNLGESSTEPT